MTKLRDKAKAEEAKHKDELAKKLEAILPSGGTLTRLPSDDHVVDVTVTKFVRVNEDGNEWVVEGHPDRATRWGFTIWDGYYSYFLIGDSYSSAAEVFEDLRSEDVLKTIEGIDDYKYGFADVIREQGGFWINRFNSALGDKGEWVEVEDAEDQ